MQTETKSISFGKFDSHAAEYVSELVGELLRDKGIEPASFSFSIEVDYTEDVLPYFFV